MSVELHLPDLPEVPISLGPAPGSAPRARVPWHRRVRDAVSAYLPLLLMTLLALATWWLVKNTPVPGAPVDDAPVRTAPDYTMTRFSLERFAADGRLTVRIEGERLRHFPDSDRIEIEDVRIRAHAPEGRVTVARAQRALANGDASEVQLIGGAEIVSQPERGAPLTMQGDFLHAFLVTERVRTHLPVRVRQGASELQAGGLEYDHGSGRLELKGPIRAVFAPPAGGAS